MEDDEERMGLRTPEADHCCLLYHPKLSALWLNLKGSVPWPRNTGRDAGRMLEGGWVELAWGRHR